MLFLPYIVAKVYHTHCITPMRPVQVSDLPAAPQEESGYNDLQRVLATHRAAIDNAITVYAEVTESACACSYFSS